MSIELRKVDLRVKLLRLLKSSEMYGYEILKKLRHEQGTAHSGFLYGKLREMEAEGLLKSRSLGRSKGPDRRSYQITKQGEQLLKAKLIESISTIIDFYSDYVSELPPDKILPPSGLTLERAEEIRNLVLVSDFSSSIVETATEAAMKRLGKVWLYFIKPADVNINWAMERSTTLNGTFSQIPLKDEFADFLVAMRPPKSELPNAVREFRRVLTKNGRIQIYYPTTLIKQTFSEPLSFSDFITWADQDYWHEQLVDEQELMRLLKKYFASVTRLEGKVWRSFIYTAMARPLP